jgi:hypothetical protein
MISRKGIKNKINIDFGISDYFKFYKKKYKSAISSQKYNKIISEYNTLVSELITDEQFEFNIPFQLGTLCVRKIKPKLYLGENGTVINKLPINPIETFKLWESNPEAKARKIYVRYMNKHSNGYMFSLYYVKGKAKFKNKQAYTISCKRSMKRRLSKNIKEGSIDAYLINNYKENVTNN